MYVRDTENEQNIRVLDVRDEGRERRKGGQIIEIELDKGSLSWCINGEREKNKGDGRERKRGRGRGVEKQKFISCNIRLFSVHSWFVSREFAPFFFSSQHAHRQARDQI